MARGRLTPIAVPTPPGTTARVCDQRSAQVWNGSATLPTQIRRSMALLALHSAWVTLRTVDVSDEERNDAALEVALELVE